MGKNKYFLWAIKEIYIFKKTYILFMIIESVIKSILPIVSIVIIKKIIDVIQYKFLSEKKLLLLVTILVVTQLLGEIILNISNLYVSKYELEFETYFHEKVLKKISKLNCKDFENSHTYDLINRTQYDANAGILGSVKLLFSLLTSIINTITYTIIIIRLNIWLFLVVSALPIIRYYYEKKYGLMEYEVEKINTEPNRENSYILQLLTNSEYYKEIKMLNLFSFFIKKYKNIKEICNMRFINIYNRRVRVYNIICLLENIIDFFITVVLIHKTYIGIFSIGSFTLYNNSIENFKNNIIGMLSNISNIYRNSVIVEQIHMFFGIKLEDTNKKGIEIDNIKNIKLKNLCYRYKGSEKYVLKNINIDISSNDFIVLMGYNGSGKSTLIKIIMGIYTDYEGEILINGVDMKNINLDIYRQNVSVLFQNYIKFESSVAENVYYGDICGDNKRFNDVITNLNIKDNLPDIHKKLGYQFSGGSQISIGQWQKLAIGRTLYKNADLYIFDELNASLDIQTESEIWETILTKMKEKISIVILHRFDRIIEKADKIIVLERGKIEEIGIHEELLKNNKLYSNLYNCYLKRRLK